MLAAVFQGIEKIGVEQVSDPVIRQPEDIIVRTEATAICGSDLHVYFGRERGLDPVTVMGHEFVGEVVATGRAVRRIPLHARVMMPFTTSCGQCHYCRGWAHYVGQEKLRPQTGWTPLAFALDWIRPPRQMNSTSFFYAHTDQWRYEKLWMDEVISPLADKKLYGGSMIDYNVRAERMGWLPSAPQLQTNPLQVVRDAASAGMEPRDYAVKSLKDGSLKMGCTDPDHPDNWPRNMFVWRSNLLGSSGKGHEYFLKHLLGTSNGLQGKDLGAEGKAKAKEAVWHEKGPEAKLDLLVTLDFRMSTTCVYSDIVLPTATWYEKNDLNTSDMHPFIHEW